MRYRHDGLLVVIFGRQVASQVSHPTRDLSTVYLKNSNKSSCKDIFTKVSTRAPDKKKEPAL
jgi:hypothetical protein